MAENTHIALLRGINVGGRNKLPMADLRALFEEVGCSQVQTYIQSGNVVFKADPELAIQIPGIIKDAVSQKFGFEIPIVTRTAEELRVVVQGNPFLDSSTDERTLHVAFLSEIPAAENIKTLDPARSPPDEFVLRAREIYLRLPNGVARTKLTNAYFDSKLGTTSTVRNWRTTIKLSEMV
jgi:uncharacterized protein (DUF1697 family)